MKNTTNSKLRLISILLTAVAVTSLLVWQSSQSKKVTKQAHIPAVTLKSTSLPALKLLITEQRKGQTSQNELQLVQVSSLQNTQPDGAVNLDESGNVKADKDLHRLFDYYLSTLGELAMPEIKKLLLMSASDYLSLNQLEQLRDYFDQYVAYLEQAENFAISFHDDEPLEQRLIQIKNLRKMMLSEEMSEAFFADEHAYAEWVLTQSDIPTDQLTEQQLQWLKAENDATAYQDVWLQNQDLKHKQVSSAEIQVARVETYGEEVALRLAALDEQQMAWQTKVDRYIEYREMVNNHQELQALNQQYDSIEIKRLDAYWRDYVNES